MIYNQLSKYDVAIIVLLSAMLIVLEQTPHTFDSFIENDIGKLIVCIIPIVLFIHSHPISGMFAIAIVYYMFFGFHNQRQQQRNNMITFDESTELEQEIVNKMAPFVSSETIFDSNITPSITDVYNSVILRRVEGN